MNKDSLKRFSEMELFTGKTRSLRNRVLMRYLFKELFMYFFVAFLFFFMVFFVNQILLLAESILKKRVPLKFVVQLIIYCLPAIIAQSSPFATLVGFLMCLGRMMSDNEILIFRASGQSYHMVLKPVLVLGLSISVVSFFVNDYLLPLSTIKYNQLYRQILQSIPTVELESNSIKRMNNTTLVIGDVNGSEVSDLVIFDRGADGKDRIIVAGQSGVEKSTQEGVLMQMSLGDAVVSFFDRDVYTDFDVLESSKATMNIFDSTVFGSSSTTSPREMTSYDLGKQIQDMKKEEHPRKRTLNVYRMEFHKKFSIPFGSIFFAFLAVGLAFLFGKHNGQTIGLIIGLVICVLYWAMMILGQIFSSRNGMDGFWMMWLPNLVIGGAAFIFYTVLVRKR